MNFCSAHFTRMYSPLGTNDEEPEVMIRYVLLCMVVQKQAAYMH